jgi:Mg/Co/Ni transporter MgtE
MKYVLAILIPFLLIGGTVAGLYYSGIGPFARVHSKPKAASSTAVASKTSDTSSASSKTSQSSNSNTSGNFASVGNTLPQNPPIQKISLPQPPPDPKIEENLTRMASVYEDMQPEDAVRIFSKLPDPLVEKLMKRMDERQVSQILTLMPLDRSARLTRALTH